MVDDIRADLELLRDNVAERLEAIVHAPTLRGVSHLLAAIVAVFGAIWLALHASSGIAMAGGLVFGVGLALAMATSGVYHRLRTRPRAAAIMRKLDHSMIFVLVASTYTPILLLTLDGWWRAGTLLLVWTMAATGIIMRLAIRDISRFALTSMYIGLGWLAVPITPLIYERLSMETIVLICAGGALYTIGAVIYVARRPDPLPRIFGFHEVFHVMVVAAAVCHYLAVYPLVSSGLSAV